MGVLNVGRKHLSDSQMKEMNPIARTETKTTPGFYRLLTQVPVRVVFSPRPTF
jgi:hypothetical protein